MARTSHIKIRRLIEEKIRSLPDRDFFLSPSYSAYLTDMAEILVKRYGMKRCIVRVMECERAVAFTDNEKIVINYNSDFVRDKITRKGKHEMIMGLLLHEVGHMLYTNFELTKQNQSDLLKIGSLELLPEEEELETEFATYFSRFKGSSILNLLKVRYHFLINALEDAHVNRRVCNRFPGVSKALEMVVDELIMSAPSFSELLSYETSKASTIASMIHLYAISSELLYEESEMYDERVQALVEVVDLIDESVYTNKSSDRVRIQNTIFAKLLPFLKEEFDGYDMDEISDEELDDLIAEHEDGTDSRTSAPTALADEEASEIAEKYRELREAADPVESEDDDLGSEESVAEDPYEDVRRMASEANPFNSDGDASEDESASSAVNDLDAKSDRDIEKILNELLEKEVEHHEEKEFADELNSFAAEIKHSEIHRGVKCCVMRKPDIEPGLVESYDAVADVATRYGRQTAKQFEKLVMKRKKGFKLDGLYSGRHFEAHSYSRGDGKCFSRKVAPTNHPNLAVMVLVDESGSTSGMRIQYEKLAALVIHDFCKRLGVPVSIYGHYETFDTEKVILTAYADADKPDEKDKYRIMGIDAHDNNRDGYALKFAAEKLLKQNADFRLLISISDGQPAAAGYGGMIGCEDVAGVVKEYKRKGITPIAAAIGDDKEAIEHIYRENFLNISDLETLPKRLTDLVKRYVK